LGTACILDGLCGEEEVFGSRIVVLSIFGSTVRIWFLTGGVFEEKDDAVDGGELMEEVGVKGDEFFELDIFDPEVV